MVSDDDFKVAFETVLAERHEGRLHEAKALGEDLLSRLHESQRRFRAMVHGTLGFIHERLLDPAAEELHRTASARLSPRSELASLSLFHVLAGQARWQEALAEAVRFVTLADSDEYRELFTTAFRTDVDPDLRALADDARAQLERHRTTN